MAHLRRSGNSGKDAEQSHPFRETNDPGIAAFASGGSQYGGSQVNMLATTANYLRSTRCAVPGCGKERHDPIHRPADD